MNSSLGGETPAVLQLHKWEPSQFPLNLSEFREAFISPTREQLLLLSYESEALLLPLVNGDSTDEKLVEGCRNECLPNKSSSAFCSQSSKKPSYSDPKENISLNDASVMDFDGEVSQDAISRSSAYTFVYDVSSLAWGVCGESYNLHDDLLFRELLFVRGSNGITVHAFCGHDKIVSTRTMTESEVGQGRWVEWGPSRSVQNMRLHESFGLHSDGSSTNSVVKEVNENGESWPDLSGETSVNQMPRDGSSKRWLSSFFVQAETIKSNGNMWTRFPEKTSFPGSAKVVSFSILDENFPVVDLLSHLSSIPNKEESQHETFLAPRSNMNMSTGSSDNSRASSFKCSRVFSSNSHCLIGFVLLLTDSLLVHSADENGSSSVKIMVLVARLGSLGVQWVSLVKLAHNVNVDPVTEWTDFCFSDNLLVCLNASGLIYFYAAMSGEFVAQLDVLQACGFNPQSTLWQEQIVSATIDQPLKQVDQIYDKSTSQLGDLFGRRMFRKLLVTIHTSLLAVVDEWGIIYVLCVGGYLPENYYTHEKLLPHFQHLGLGTLVNWEVGGSDIGSQRKFSCNSSVRKGDASISQCNTKNAFQTIIHGKGTLVNMCSSISCSSSEYTSCDSKVHLQPMRKIFLPTERFSEHDCICFSSLGITRLARKQNNMSQCNVQVSHLNLHTGLVVRDDAYLNYGGRNFQGNEEASVGEAIGCIFQGCLYLVNEFGISVVLPAVSLSSSFLPVETTGYWQQCFKSGARFTMRKTLQMKESKELFSAWKVEVLDKVLLYEGPEEADRLCLENDWDIRISRMRRLQMALDYLKFDEMELSLEMLVGVNLVEEGILRLIFAAVYLMCHRNGSDNDLTAVSRVLALATSFATKMIRKCGLVQRKTGKLRGLRKTPLLSLPPIVPDKVQNDIMDSTSLHDLARLLEIVRSLQYRLRAKFKKPGQGLVDGGEALNLMDTNLSDDEPLPIVPANAVSLQPINQQELSVSLSSMGSKDDKLAVLSRGVLDSSGHSDQDDLNAVSIFLPQAGNFGRKIFPLENPKEMIARWEIDNLDINTVVKDALLSDRLPLAVLQLHLHRSKDLDTDQEPPDTFAEVRDVGRAIAYDLFLKGETAHAIATLQRLGEDIEVCLKQLLYGTVRRSLRIQVAEEARRYGYVGPFEWKIIEMILLIERLYPSSSFWRTFLVRQKTLTRVDLTSHSPGGIKLQLLHSHVLSNYFIECGEVDGVVLGLWTSINENSAEPIVDEDTANAGYWAAAAVWSSAWDPRTVDRIVLDQPFLMGVHVVWESQLEYYLCHNDWEEVLKLMDLIPATVISSGSLQISLDGLKHEPAIGCSSGYPEYSNYICSIEEVDSVCMEVPGIKIFRFPVESMCSLRLRMLVEQELAKKFIFLKDYWESTTEILPLLARSGFVTTIPNLMQSEDYTAKGSFDLDVADGGNSLFDTSWALHKILLHYCIQYKLPNLLELYLDHHKLVLNSDRLHLLHEASGDCQWAKWLLLNRIKGREYDASFCNARCIMSHDSNLSVLEVEDIIRTVDDIAEGAGEMAALATLMYASESIQSCLSSGSVSRHSSSTAQCTLENLRPALQQFPTLRRTLVDTSFGQDSSNLLGSKANNALSKYLCWRDNIFFSSARDTSLLQMLPCWFPKTVRRLIQLYIQGPLGWQSFSGLPVGDSLLDREIDFYIHADEHTEISSVSWEATIQKQIQEELFDSSIEETGHGLEHHLHRGRALAAFNYMLGVRVQKLKLEGQPGSSSHGQTNVQSDVQTLLGPLTDSEGAILSSVIPLAITHFENSVLVASCAFLLELCGVSASMLRIDIACLRRISSFYKLSESNERYGQISPKTPAFQVVSPEVGMVESLARSLADEYLRKDGINDGKVKQDPDVLTSEKPSRVVLLVLQHLEKASLPEMIDGRTCGSWLLSGIGDGAELRSLQKAASQRWNLVSVFCQMHGLLPSTKYLAILARDNDWVGFLSEAQIGGYSFDAVVQVASMEFSDPRLRSHILTVLKGMQSRKQVGSPSYSDNANQRSETLYSDMNVLLPTELFRILADCEKQKNQGEALLRKAKEMSWSLLAMIASCFPDVSPLSCLTVWLEITAARETSAIKVNDVASQIAANVGAAVEANNSLVMGNRTVTIHYNRQSPKRRRLVEPVSIYPLVASADVASSCSDPKVCAEKGLIGEEETKPEIGERIKILNDVDEGPASLPKMVAVLCEQRLFLPLLKAFDMFLPSCSLLPFIRALQAFSQMRLSEAAAHLGSFSVRIKDESTQSSIGREEQTGTWWSSSTAVKAANAMLSTCPSPYEKRCLLQLLAATDFGDGGSAAGYYRRLYWKINLAEPLLRKDDDLHLGNETLDDSSLLTALEKNGHWEQARNWARQLEASGGPWKSAVHHVTETQAESMVTEWKEFLWDVPEERVALWGHCQTLFIRYAFPPLQAGLFFLKHAEMVEKDLPARELHELLLLSLQWLSGMITLCNPVYPINLLREIETRVWLLAVESEAQAKSDGDLTTTVSSRDLVLGNSSNIIDKTASLITKMDVHINTMKNRLVEKHDVKENTFGLQKNQVVDVSTQIGGNIKIKRRAKAYQPSRRQLIDPVDGSTDSEDVPNLLSSRNELQFQDENVKLEISFSKWEERVGPAELERAVLSLLEFGQITAAKQLQHKLSPEHSPPEFLLVDTALKLAAISTPNCKVSPSMLDEKVASVVQSYNIYTDQHSVDPLEVLESLATIFSEGCGRGLCKRIVAVVKAANILGLSFSEAFEKQPIELLQLLSLKAQESFEEASLLVQTHSMPAASIAQILAESFLKGLLAAHRGGYMDSQKEEGPAPLLWRFSDFLKWSEFCPSQPEIGHSLMRLVITGQEIPHACEVELLILSHHFYKSSACLDGVDVLVALAATRVEAYVSEGDFPCLARLITGVGNFHALNFILGILIENGQLDLLLQKYSAAAETNAGTADAVRGFRMAVLTSLKHFNPKDLDAFAMVYNHFDMKHETAFLLESRAKQSSVQWFHRYDKDQNEDLLESMRYFIEAAEVYSSIDAGNRTRKSCADASLVSLQIRMPDSKWLELSETNARRLLVEQSRFQEALIVAEAYGLNQPTEWALVLWNQMLKPELTEEFVAEFVAVLPLQPTMLVELARFYRAEVAARGDQSQFSVWLTGGGLPAEWAKYLGRSFRCLLKRTRDLRLRLQLATVATGFTDVIDACTKALDKVPDSAGPLILRKGHGGAYLPLM
ncbi:hypothetical protein M5689_011476 [Euphorbia peplus]|nr:hypothetical protein M5689_011476 [Euphorbia peplus]